MQGSERLALHSENKWMQQMQVSSPIEPGLEHNVSSTLATMHGPQVSLGEGSMTDYLASASWHHFVEQRGTHSCLLLMLLVHRHALQDL